MSCNSPTNCTAVGYNYTNNNTNTTVTLAESWNGSSWTVQPTPTPEGSLYANLDAVSCASSTDCTAVGYNSGSSAIAEGWNGTTWSLELTPYPDGPPNDLAGVSCGSPNSCTAVGGIYISPSDLTLIENRVG